MAGAPAETPFPDEMSATLAAFRARLASEPMEEKAEGMMLNMFFLPLPKEDMKTLCRPSPPPIWGQVASEEVCPLAQSLHLTTRGCCHLLNVCRNGVQLGEVVAAPWTT